MSWIDEVRHDIAALSSADPELKKFGITMGIVAAVLSLVMWWRNWTSTEVVIAAGAVSVFFFICSYGRPQMLQAFHKGWMAAAIVAGSIVSRIILLFLFFIILTPMALAARIVGKKFYTPFRESGKKSYWIHRDRTKKINYEQMF